MTLNYREIAKSVIKLAHDFDHRLPIPTSERIDSWAKLFEGHVWPKEAVDAVLAHYRNPNAFPILPGDVVGYCKQQPVWSSPEHAREWVLYTAEHHPWSDAIWAYSDIEPAEITVPEGVTKSKGTRAYVSQRMVAWATENIESLTDAILARQYVRGAPQ